MPTINIAVFNIALAQFARDIEAGQAKRIVLVLDGAGWHSSGQVNVPGLVG